MGDLRISEMQRMQLELWEKNKDKWSPLTPEYARESILWMIEELGEAIAIIKKRGEKDIMEDSDLREKFVEELADVYMYFNDILLRFGVSANEISDAYVRKFEKNMKRDFDKEHSNYLKGEQYSRS